MNYYLPFYFLLSFTFIKSFYLSSEFYKWVETHELYKELAFMSLQSDLLIVLLFFLAFYFSQKLGSKILFYLFLVLSILTMLLIYIDMQTLLTFNRRLLVVDILKFSSSGLETTFIIKYFIIYVPLILITLAITYLLTFFVKKPYYLVMALVVIMIIPTKTDYFKTHYLSKNIILTNLSFGYAKNYHDKKRYEQEFLNSHTLKKGDNNKSSFIIVLAESWSAVDSKQTSQLEIDNLPLFDEISKEGKNFTNFFAEGSTTDQAYISILTGLPALLYNFNSDTYSPFYTNDNLINFLNDNNYHTSFYKAYSLDFLNIRQFLNHLNFTYIAGKEERFNKEPFYSMNAVSDEVLYRETYQEIEKKETPFFMMMTTISTHIPFSTPDGDGETTAYHYSDKAFYDFYQKLKLSGYLQDNYLILVGDHRKMTPLNKGEFQRYNESAFARVACTIWGGDTTANSIDENFYNQTDITNSIKRVVAKETNLPKSYNDIFKEEIKRDFVIHDTFANRSEIVIFNQHTNISATFHSDGDKSYITPKNPHVLEYINTIKGHYQYRNTVQ